MMRIKVPMLTRMIVVCPARLSKMFGYSFLACARAAFINATVVILPAEGDVLLTLLAAMAERVALQNGTYIENPPPVHEQASVGDVQNTAVGICLNAPVGMVTSVAHNMASLGTIVS